MMCSFLYDIIFVLTFAHDMQTVNTTTEVAHLEWRQWRVNLPMMNMSW